MKAWGIQLSLLIFSTCILVYGQQPSKADSLIDALNSKRESSDSSQLYTRYYQVGYSLYLENRYFEASEYLDSAFVLAPREMKPKTLNLMGSVAWFLGKFDSALSLYQNSLIISESLNNKKFEAMALNNIGFIYSEYKEYTKTLDYYQQALEIRREIEDLKGVGLSLSSIGRVYYQFDSLQKSYSYYIEALSIFKDIDDKQGISNALNNLGNIYLRQGKTNNAVSSHKEALRMRVELNNTFLITESHKNLAQIYIDNENYIKAAYHINEGIREAEEIKSIKALKNLYYLDFLLNDKQSNYKDALASFINYSDLKDSLISAEGEKRVAQLEAEYQFAKKEKQIEILDQQNLLKTQKLKTRNYLLYFVLTFLLLSIIISILILHQQRLKSKLFIELNRQRLLRSQMNPHFIYNSLTSIQGFVLENNPIDSATYIAEFAKLMRLVLEGSRADWVSVEDDIKLAKSYLKLQKFRFNNSFQFDVEVEEALNTEWFKVPPMLSQPFIENAVEHGLRGLENNTGLILVRYSHSDKNLIISIQDNGKGFRKTDKPESRKHSPLARKITTERIENLKKTHKITIGLNTKFKSDPDQTIIEFTVPQKHQLK